MPNVSKDGMAFFIFGQTHPPHVAKETFCSALTRKGVPLF